MKVLSEVLKHHVKEEESGIFQTNEQSSSDLDEHGQQIFKEKAERPETWVTDWPGDIGYTFAPNGLSSGCNDFFSRSTYPKSYCIKLTSQTPSSTSLMPTGCPARASVTRILVFLK